MKLEYVCFLIVLGLFAIFYTVATQPIDVSGVSFGPGGTPFPVLISFTSIFSKVSWLGSVGALLPLFLATAVSAVLVPLFGRHESSIEEQRETQPERGMLNGRWKIWIIVSVSIMVLLNVYQWFVHNWLPYGWDTPQLLWQPLQYTGTHSLFPPNPYRVGLIDTPPGYLLLLTVLYNIIPVSPLEIFQAVQLTLVILAPMSVFCLARELSSNSKVGAIAVVLFSLGLGFYILEWGSFQNLFAVVLLNFGIAALFNKNGLLYSLSPILLVSAIFSHDTGTIFVIAIASFVIFWNLASLLVGGKHGQSNFDRTLLRTIFPFVASALISLPYEAIALSERGHVLTDTSNLRSSITILTTTDFLRSTGGVIILGILGGIFVIEEARKKRDLRNQVLIGYLIVALLLTTPYFFVYQFRFLWMLSIPLSICAASLLCQIGRIKVFEKWFALILIGLFISQLAFAASVMMETSMYSDRYGFPGTYVSSQDIQAITWLETYFRNTMPNRPAVVITPSQFNNWIIAIAHLDVLPQDQQPYENESVSQWVVSLEEEKYDVYVMANDAYPSFLEGALENQPCPIYFNGWDYVLKMNWTTCDALTASYRNLMNSSNSISDLSAGTTHRISFSDQGALITMPAYSSFQFSLSNLGQLFIGGQISNETRFHLSLSDIVFSNNASSISFSLLIEQGTKLHNLVYNIQSNNPSFDYSDVTTNLSLYLNSVQYSFDRPILADLMSNSHTDLNFSQSMFVSEIAVSLQNYGAGSDAIMIGNVSLTR